MDPNSHEALLRRRDAATLTWRGPALMLLARTTFAVGAQGVFAAIFALRGSPTPWRDAEPWLPVYGTLIDAGCLTLKHAFMPLTFDARFMTFRLLGSVPYAIVGTILYLRLRRLLPLAIAHALMDGATVLIPLLAPLLRATR